LCAGCTFCIAVFKSLLILLRIKIYYKMQREKLYNLHTTTYFIAALFFQNRQNFEQSDCYHAKKIMFSMHSEFIFIISLFHHLIFFIKRKTKYTTRCSVKSSTIQTVKLIVIVFRKGKILCSQFSQCPKFDPSKLNQF
jgi:hypothetical protein